MDATHGFERPERQTSITLTATVTGARKCNSVIMNSTEQVGATIKPFKHLQRNRTATNKAMALDFYINTIYSGHLQHIAHEQWPSALWTWRGAHWQPAGVGTSFGAVASGEVILSCDSGRFTLREGMVFCVPGPLTFEGDGAVFGCTHTEYRGFFQIAGPVEERGRLRYIDGCSDSLLIAPQRRGDPCLNHLHFPPGIDQTAHTHPSFRAGLVLQGQGVCKLEGRNVPLQPGKVFLIPADLNHAFRTDGQSMDVIAFHPDSDFGPDHDEHPMINRTIVNGVSARFTPEIQTRSLP